jgi:phosphoribosylformylglycinamidine synthase subunit PurQ / glutaminase
VFQGRSNAPRDAVQALVVRAAGTNCDQETIHALTQAGATCELRHVNEILTGRIRLHPYHILVFPGGFSYGDDIAAGKVLANELRLRLKDQLQRFVESGKLVIGICNGFQVLIKSGLLPGFDTIDSEQLATLTLNNSGRFQSEWVGMAPEKSAATWLDGLPAKFDLPIAHGEGKFISASPKVLAQLKKNRQIILRYSPVNPNGSEADIAGICNARGNVVAMMPHPERFVTRFQHPNWPNIPARMNDLGEGFIFWEKAVAHARTLAKVGAMK